MNIVFAGNPEPAVKTLIALRQHHTVVAVITSIEKPQGRGNKISKSPVAMYALEQGLPLIETVNINADDRIAALNFDMGVVVAFGQLIGPGLLKRSPWMNVHYSLLPRWRGASPVQHALLYGDDITGVTTFFLESELDAGPIIAQATYVPQPHETTSTLLNALTDVGADVAIQSLRIIEQGVVEAKMQSGEITYAPKLVQEDCRVDWKQSAIAIERRVRALYEKPTAFTTLNKKRVQLGPLEISTISSEASPGVVFGHDRDVFVSTGSVPVRLGMLKPEGKSWMHASDWWRGIQQKDRVEFE